jgi:hypothetical protein
MSVFTTKDSAPGSDTVLRTVSLEPVGPEGVQREQNFPEKWPVDWLSKKKATSPKLFNENFLLNLLSD